MPTFPVKTKTQMICMDVYPWEYKLINRLRMLRNKCETSVFMVTTNPLTIAPVGQIELLEHAPLASGSLMGY